MSRLDSFIRRVHAQRDCLNRAVELIAEIGGPVFELGLGNGRTYDHLREKLADREIFVFERKVAAHPDCVPPDQYLILGDVLETLPDAATRFEGRVALAHVDIGTGDAEANARLIAALAPRLTTALAPGAIVVSDQPFEDTGWEPLPLPEGIQPDRYHLYRA